MKKIFATILFVLFISATLVSAAPTEKTSAYTVTFNIFNNNDVKKPETLVYKFTNTDTIVMNKVKVTPVKEKGESIVSLGSASNGPTKDVKYIFHDGWTSEVKVKDAKKDGKNGVFITYKFKVYDTLESYKNSKNNNSPIVKREETVFIGEGTRVTNSYNDDYQVRHIAISVDKD